MLGPASYRRPVLGRSAAPRRSLQRAVPYYRQQDSRRWRAAAWSLAAATVVGLGWLLLASPALAVRNVQVEGLQRTDRATVDAAIDSQLNSRWLLVFSRRTQLLAPTEAIRRAVEALPTVKSASVSRSLPGTLTVKVEERIASIEWETAGQRYEVDLEGKVIRPLEAAKAPSGQPSLPRIVDSANATTTVGATVASQQLIGLAIEASAGPQGRGSDFSSTGPSPSELYVHTGGMKVLVTANKPLAEQYESAQKVVATVPKEDLPRLDLVDVRLPELPTYKLR